MKVLFVLIVLALPTRWSSLTLAPKSVLRIYSDLSKWKIVDSVSVDKPNAFKVPTPAHVNTLLLSSTLESPRAKFRVQYRISGWRKSDLGLLYNPFTNTSLKRSMSHTSRIRARGTADESPWAPWSLTKGAGKKNLQAEFNLTNTSKKTINIQLPSWN